MKKKRTDENKSFNESPKARKPKSGGTPARKGKSKVEGFKKFIDKNKIRNQKNASRKHEDEGEFDKKSDRRRSENGDSERDDRSSKRTDRNASNERFGNNKKRFDKKGGQNKSWGADNANESGETTTSELAEGETMRLNKYVANSGISSRRKADELIKQGFVKVNNEVVREMGFRVKKGDKVEFKDKVIRPEARKVYFLMNKPKNTITTTNDEKGRKTVMDIIEGACKERIYPVGRLDRDTTGLLLFTNDGDLAKKLSHPSYEIKKIYHAILDKPITMEDMEKIRQGLTLEDGQAPVDKVEYDEGRATGTGVVITVHIGRNRIIRRIFAHLGYTVIKLDRIYYGGLTKKNLSRGFHRPLKGQEVIMLKHFV